MSEETKSFVGANIRIIYKNDIPYGIRDNSGFLLFFDGICRYTGQDARYEKELSEKNMLADYLLRSLKDVK